MLRLQAEPPAQLAMDFYCQRVEEAEKKVVRDRAVTTPPVVLFNEYHSFKQAEKRKGASKKGKISNYRQKPHFALKELRKLAQNRDGRKALTSEIVKVCRHASSAMVSLQTAKEDPPEGRRGV